MNSIKQSIHSYERLSLADMDQVRLMNRVDQKFCLKKALLPGILDEIAGDYSVLEIENEVILPYQTTYFDTADDKMYLSHQNGKLNRYKVRSRKYVISDNNFLEIKFKTNKGRTQKERIHRASHDTVLKNEEKAFLAAKAPYAVDELEPKLNNRFFRITLVNKEFTDRVTIDIMPEFECQGNDIQLNNLVIIEVKQDKNGNPARIVEVLKEHKIKKEGFSKYCIGRALLEENIKKNSFKPRLLRIQKEFIAN